MTASNKMTKFHQDALNEFRMFLSKPTLSLKDLEPIVGKVSAKNLKDWNRKNILSSSRSNKLKSWHRFSMLDTAQLLIIIKLRRLNVPIQEINEILKPIKKKAILENALLKCIKGKKVLIAFNNKKAIFTLDLDFIDWYFNQNKSSFDVSIFPFYRDIKRLIVAMNKLGPVDLSKF